MSETNEIRKAIMERLGSVAKFAITKEQIRAASSEELRAIDRRLGELAKSGDKNAAALLDYVREEYNDRYRGTHSRPGAKAKMGRAEKVMRDGSVHLDFGAAKEWLSAASESELRYIVQDSRSAAQANPDGKKWNYYHDLAITAAEMLSKRMKSSRPGAKAKMGLEPNVSRMREVRNDIANLADTQMRLSNKASDSMKRNYHERVAYGLQSFIGRAPYHAEIAMEYKGAQYWNKRAMALAQQGQAYGVIGDTLIKEALAIYNSFSRPGAKAKFATWEVERTKRYDKPIVEHTAKIRGNSFKIEAPDGSSRGALYLWNDMRGFERIETGDIESLKRTAETMGAKEARGVAAIERRANYSRPGAKAKMARTEEEYIKDIGDTWTILMQSLKSMQNAMMLRNYRECRSIVAKMTQTLARLDKDLANPVDFSRPGAKSTHAADEAVSKKIALLMDEGYPQDQAVAIALDMKRKGKI